MRGGKDNDPNWFTRMRGSGPWADLLKARFERAVKKARPQPGQTPAAPRPVRTAAGGAVQAVLEILPGTGGTCAAWRWGPGLTMLAALATPPPRRFASRSPSPVRGDFGLSRKTPSPRARSSPRNRRRRRGRCRSARPSSPAPASCCSRRRARRWRVFTVAGRMPSVWETVSRRPCPRSRAARRRGGTARAGARSPPP